MPNIFIDSDTPALLLHGSHNPWLVIVSIVVAIISSMMSLQIAGMARSAKGRLLHQVALVSGSLALGGGIWSMHFIGMLAFELGTHVHYSPAITVMSMAPSVFASWVTLQMLSHDRITRRQLVIGGIMVGAGIGAMHYSGMAAMHMDAILRYDLTWFITSIVVAVVLAMLALWIRFGLTNQARFSPAQATLLAGVIMGLAIAGMHYTGMAAARFIGTPDNHFAADNSRNFLAIIIGVTTVAISLLVLAGNLVLRYRQLYNQMQENESRLRAIVDTAVDGIITIDGNGSIIAMNHAAEKLFGWTFSELKGKNINMLMPEPYHSGHDQYLKNYHTTHQAKIIGVGREVTALRKDGKHVPVRLAVGKAEIPGQNLFVGFVSDLSERIAMERELSSREQQYRTLIDNIPGVAFRCQANAPWAAIFISDAITALSGWETEKFYAGEINLGDLVHPDDADRVAQELAPAMINKTSYVIEYRIIRRDKTERWVSESASGVYDDDGNLHWIDGVIMDITESKLRNAEFEGVVHAISRALAVTEFDMNGNIIGANENFLALTGYELTELYGKHHSMLCLPEEINSAEYRAFWDNLRQGNFQSGEFLRLGKERKKIWIQAVYNPIFDADGKPWKVVKLATDLSERKAMETDLMIAKDRAEKASSAKGMFLANMSHEIRTPMNAIIGFTEVLINSPLQPEQLKHLHTVRRSAGSLLSLLNDILDTAKLERGALELDIEAFSLKELCSQILQELQIQADKKSLALVFDYLPGTRDHVLGDALRLRQVVVNLLGNAVKFTEQGEVTLRVMEDGPNVSVKVIDTGIGIAEDRIQHIFTPFTQADASMARRFGGTGLGTTIARQLTELMGGTITATSAPGKGSCFEVSLPLPAAHAVKKALPTQKIVLPILNILIADDVPQNLEVLQLMLTRDGHRTVTASNGLEACQRFQQQTFDIVLMDIQMPEVDGLQASKMIRQWEAAQAKPATPIIALTASVLEQDRKDAKAAGMNGFASKPINLIELHNEMARCLGVISSTTKISPALTGTREIIDWENAESRWGDRAVLTKAIRQFCADNKHFLALINSADIHRVKQEAHRMKGAAANLGLVSLATLANRIELENSLSPSLFNDIETAFIHIRSELDIPPANLHHTTPPTFDRIEVKLLEQLMQAYQHGTFDDDAYRTLAKALPATVITPLDEALEQFDFDTAVALLSAWIETADWVTRNQ
ncbi:MAG TPA: PAS domain S-box protein [Cellvibrio sp.]